MKTPLKKAAGLIMAGVMTLFLAGATLSSPIFAAQSDTIHLAQQGSRNWATNAKSNLTTFSNSAGISTQGDLTSIIGKIIRGFLGLLGTVFVVLTIYAGYLWMTASGNEEQITKAKKLITNAVIGIIIILLAYMVTDFVFKALAGATTAAPG